MEIAIIALICITALAYLYFFFKKGLKGDCGCKSGTCHLDCKSQKSCEKSCTKREN